jgi:hypothetical protein
VGYVEGPLKATKERDQKVLGGARPDLHILPNDFKFNNAFALASLDSYPSDTAVTDFGIPASELPVNNPGDFTYPQNRTLEGFTADPVSVFLIQKQRELIRDSNFFATKGTENHGA